MSHLSKKCLLAALFLPTCAVTQNVDRTKYKDYSYPPPSDLSLMCTRTVAGQVASVRPDHVNNGENIYFPPVFNRDGGSCGSERQKTCAYVDTYKNNDLTVMTAWDGFDNTLTNHKIFQSVELPAGAYEFTAHFGDYDGQAAGSYVAAALGTSLPDTEDLASQALGYTEMQSKSGTCTSNSVFFVLPEPAEVSVGLVVNMGGLQCMAFSSFSLTKYPLEQIEALPEGIEPITQPEAQRDDTIYDLSGRRVLRPEQGGVYIIGKQKVILI